MECTLKKTVGLYIEKFALLSKPTILYILH